MIYLLKHDTCTVEQFVIFVQYLYSLYLNSLCASRGSDRKLHDITEHPMITSSCEGNGKIALRVWKDGRDDMNADGQGTQRPIWLRNVYSIWFSQLSFRTYAKAILYLDDPCWIGQFQVVMHLLVVGLRIANRLRNINCIRQQEVL